MRLLLVLWTEYLQEHSLPCKLPRLTWKLFPPYLCFVYPFLGTQMSAVVTHCREASGSDGCHKGGGSYWRCSASSVMQTPLLNSHFLAPTPLSDWLLNGQRVNPTDGLNGWQPKMLWMYIVWVWGVKLPVRDIQVNAHHTAMWRQHRDMPQIAKFKMSSVFIAAFIDRKKIQ